MKRSTLSGVVVFASIAMISILANADKVSTETAFINGQSTSLDQCNGTAQAHTLQNGSVSVTVSNAKGCEKIEAIDANGMTVGTQGRDQNGMQVLGTSFPLSQYGNGTINFGQRDATQYRVKVSHQANGPFDENAHDTISIAGQDAPPAPPAPPTSGGTITLLANQWVYLPSFPCGQNSQAMIKPGRSGWILQIQQANGCDSFAKVDANGMPQGQRSAITNGSGLALLDGTFDAVKIYSSRAGASVKVLVPQFAP